MASLPKKQTTPAATAFIKYLTIVIFGLYIISAVSSVSMAAVHTKVAMVVVIHTNVVGTIQAMS
jgi:hypothetical protein